MTVKSIPSKLNQSSLLLAGLALGAGALASLLVTVVPQPSYLLLLAVGLLALLGMVLHVEVGLLLLVFTTYTRFSDNLIDYLGAPSVAKLLIPLLFLIVLTRWVLYEERPAGWQRPVLLIAAYGFVGFLGLLYAIDFSRTQTALISYAKDGSIVVLVALILQRATTFRRVIWMLLAAGIFLGTISVYQQLTGTFENTYWGFGQAGIRNIYGEMEDYRISGPLAGPNEYAQMLVVLVPLALERLWNERKPLLRFLAAWALAVCVLSIVFTFSRGGFVALIGVLVVMFIRRPPSLLALLVTVMLAIPLLRFVPPEYMLRMQTLTQILPGSQESVKNEVSFRGRLSENTSAWLMFIDRPLAGIGLNNFPIHYQNYSRTLGLDSRREIRSAHSLYLQIASEQGLLGLAVFGLVLGVMFKGLNQACQDFIRAGELDYADMVIAFSIGITGFLIAGIFLHLIYPRFLWLLIGIALTAPVIARRELQLQRGDSYAA